MTEHLLSFRSAFVRGPPRGGLINLLRHKPVCAAVAYISSANDLPLRKGDILVCDASDATAKSGGTRRDALRALLAKGVLIRSRPALHAKVVVAGNLVLVGSANWSLNSSNLCEASIRTNVPGVVNAARTFVTELWDEAEVVDDLFLQRMPEPEYPWSLRPNNKLEGWLLNCHELNRERKIHKIFAGHIEDMKPGTGRHIDYIVYPAKSKTAQQIKSESQVVLIWHHQDRSVSVYPACRVLFTMREGDHIGIYYLFQNSDEARALEWDQFKALADAIGLSRRIGKKSERGLTGVQLKRLTQLWPQASDPGNGGSR